MIQLFETKPCADNLNTVQAEGLFSDQIFSLDRLELFLKDMNYKVLSLGNPKVLICKRSDSLLLVQSNGSFNISEVSSKDLLIQIINELDINIRNFRQVV